MSRWAAGTVASGPSCYVRNFGVQNRGGGYSATDDENTVDTKLDTDCVSLWVVRVHVAVVRASALAMLGFRWPLGARIPACMRSSRLKGEVCTAAARSQRPLHSHPVDDDASATYKAVAG